jgi:hypothetical protein
VERADEHAASAGTPTLAAVLGTPLTLLVAAEWAGAQLSPHSLTILIVPLAVLCGIAAIPAAAYWVLATARGEQGAAFLSPRIIWRCALIVTNAASLAYVLPRMRW